MLATGTDTDTGHTATYCTPLVTYCHCLLVSFYIIPIPTFRLPCPSKQNGFFRRVPFGPDKRQKWLCQSFELRMRSSTSRARSEAGALHRPTLLRRWRRTPLISVGWEGFSLWSTTARRRSLRLRRFRPRVLRREHPKQIGCRSLNNPTFVPSPE